MSNVGYNTWYEKKCSTSFVVKNTSDYKTINLFQYPILKGCIRDLMEISFVSEADIRHSLLKGELKNKLLSGDAYVEYSNIDLLQFDDCQKEFLQEHGIFEGLEIGTDQVSDDIVLPNGGELNFAFRQNIDLVGTTDGVNRIFTIPNGEKFINGTLGNNEFKILVRHNGRVKHETSDYIVSESGGAGTGYDTIICVGFSPSQRSTLTANYVISV